MFKNLVFIFFIHFTNFDYFFMKFTRKSLYFLYADRDFQYPIIGALTPRTLAKVLINFPFRLNFNSPQLVVFFFSKAKAFFSSVNRINKFDL